MRSLCILASALAVAIGASANAAPADIGPATTETVGKVFVTTDPASDLLNKKITAHNDAIEAQNQAAQAAYQTQLANYEAEKRAQRAAYDAQLAEHDATVAADMSAWHARVRACSEGDRTQCGQPDAAPSP